MKAGVPGRVAMHRGQLTIDEGAVAGLVAEQFPSWVGRPVKAVPSVGTMNALFRIGDDLVARFPLQPGDPAEVRRQLEAESHAARDLAGKTPLRRRNQWR
jgi:aminoglycoside phosphotransferase (APT) family kinase protein